MGRQSTFNEKDAAEIVARLSKGEPLAVICRTEGMPCDDTVRNWADSNQEFGRRIVRAREAGFDAIALECLDIANDKEGEVQRDKLRVDTRLKLLAKWDPKRYGERLDLNNNHGVQDNLAELLNRIDGKSRGLG